MNKGAKSWKTCNLQTTCNVHIRRFVPITELEQLDRWQQNPAQQRTHPSHVGFSSSVVEKDAPWVAATLSPFSDPRPARANRWTSARRGRMDQRTAHRPSDTPAAESRSPGLYTWSGSRRSPEVHALHRWPCWVKETASTVEPRAQGVWAVRVWMGLNRADSAHPPTSPAMCPHWRGMLSAGGRGELESE